MNIAIIPIIALIFGVAGGVLRGITLLNGYEPQTLLPIYNDKFQIILTILSVICAVLFLVLCKTKCQNLPKDFEKAFASSSSITKTVCVISAALMFIFGAVGFYTAVTSPNQNIYTRISEFPLWILAVLSAVAIIIITSALSKQSISESNANLLLIPMFWAAFDLIVVFKQNASSPFLGYYSFELLPSIFLTLAFYSLAGFLYSKPKPRFMLFCSSLAIVFSYTCVLGIFITQIVNPSMWSFELSTICRCGCLLGAITWLLSLTTNLCRQQD